MFPCSWVFHFAHYPTVINLDKWWQRGFYVHPLFPNSLWKYSYLGLTLLNTHQCTKWEKLVLSFVHGQKQPHLIAHRIIIFGPIYLPFPCLTFVARALSHHHFNSYIIHVLAIEDNIAIAKEKKQLLLPLSCFLFQFFLSFLKKEKYKNKLLPPILFFLFLWNLVCEKEEAIKEERFFLKIF